MTITILETKLKKAGYYIVVDESLCEILVANNNLYPNHFRKHYSLHGWTLQEIHDDVLGKPAKSASAYNKSEIMTDAHKRRNKYGVSMSQALKDAWAQAKHANRPNQKDALIAAFNKKYPGGTLEIHQFWRGATVQFTPGGKTYTYKNYGWQQKLGITA